MQVQPVQPLAYAGSLSTPVGRIARLSSLFSIVGGGVCVIGSMLWLALQTQTAFKLSMSMWLSNVLGTAGKALHICLIVCVGIAGAGLAVAGALMLRGRAMPRSLVSAAVLLTICLLVDRAGPLVSLARDEGPHAKLLWVESVVEGVLSEVDSIIFFALVATACIAGSRSTCPGHWINRDRPRFGTILIVIGVILLTLLIGGQAGLRLHGIVNREPDNPSTITLAANSVEKTLAIMLHACTILTGLLTISLALVWALRPRASRPLTIACLLFALLHATGSIWFLVEILRIFGSFKVPLLSLLVMAAIVGTHIVITCGFFVMTALLVWRPRTPPVLRLDDSDGLAITPLRP